MLQPGGDFELTRDYLLQLDVSELTDYVLSLMAELKATKMEARKLADSQVQLGQQLVSAQQLADTCEQEREELILIQQQSAVKLDTEQQQRELTDLRTIICNLKCKAEKYDSVMKENQCLRRKLQISCEENSLSTKKVDTGDGCDGSECANCNRLKAELCIYKNQYDNIKQQRRVLMEQIQQERIAKEQVSDLKMQLDGKRVKLDRTEQRLEETLVIRYS